MWSARNASSFDTSTTNTLLDTRSASTLMRTSTSLGGATQSNERHLWEFVVSESHNEHHGQTCSNADRTSARNILDGKSDTPSGHVRSFCPKVRLFPNNLTKHQLINVASLKRSHPPSTARDFQSTTSRKRYWVFDDSRMRSEICPFLQLMQLKAPVKSRARQTAQVAGCAQTYDEGAIELTNTHTHVSSTRAHAPHDNH